MRTWKTWEIKKGKKGNWEEKKKKESGLFNQQNGVKKKEGKESNTKDKDNVWEIKENQEKG